MEEKNQAVTSVRRNTKKILNNSYKNGDNLKSSEEYEFTRSLSVDMINAEQYMKVDYDVDSRLYHNMVETVNQFLDDEPNPKNSEVKEILINSTLSPEDVNFRKYTKDEMNIVFETLYGLLYNKFSLFFKISYVFQIVCNVLSVTHSSLFDALEYENKKTVLVGISNELGMDVTKCKNFVY